MVTSGRRYTSPWMASTSSVLLETAGIQTEVEAVAEVVVEAVTTGAIAEGVAGMTTGTVVTEVATSVMTEEVVAVAAMLTMMTFRSKEVT